jgi:hypothetical protein
MAESPRTFWQYLKGPMHTFELQLSSTEVLLKEYVGVGAEPKVLQASLLAFLEGALHDEITASMNASVLPEALESARHMRPASASGGVKKNAYLHPILKAAAELPQQFRDAFGKLTLEQLNWKPNPETWSVGECIDHLIVTNRSYFAQLEAIARGDKYVSFWEKVSLFHGMVGRMLIKATGETVGRKAKSPPPFRPTRSTVPANIVEEFCIQQDELMARVKNTDNVDHHAVLVNSPMSSVIFYSLHDALVIIFQHERRHFNQAKALMTRAEFPKA